MNKIKTKFIGLDLNSPIIAGSCGLNSNIENLVEMQNSGVGAVILKSVFEEQINMDIEQGIQGVYAEEIEYIQYYLRANTVSKYVDFLKEAKATLDIPVIGSICCLHQEQWVQLAKELENAGADAIELNMFLLSTDHFSESEEIENQYYRVVKAVNEAVNIPLILKIGNSFTCLPTFITKVKSCGASAVTLFNRFYEPDINLEKMELCAAPVLSPRHSIHNSLRWTGILFGKDKSLEISTSGGVYDGKDALKLILAGATTVQICSVMYDKGVGEIKNIVEDIASWMSKNNYSDIGEFKGRLSSSATEKSEIYERAQFMKYYSDRKM